MIRSFLFRSLFAGLSRTPLFPGRFWFSVFVNDIETRAMRNFFPAENANNSRRPKFKLNYVHCMPLITHERELMNTRAVAAQRVPSRRSTDSFDSTVLPLNASGETACDILVCCRLAALASCMRGIRKESSQQCLQAIMFTCTFLPNYCHGCSHSCVRESNTTKVKGFRNDSSSSITHMKKRRINWNEKRALWCFLWACVIHADSQWVKQMNSQVFFSDGICSFYIFLTFIASKTTLFHFHTLVFRAFFTSFSHQTQHLTTLFFCSSTAEFDLAPLLKW